MSLNKILLSILFFLLIIYTIPAFAECYIGTEHSSYNEIINNTPVKPLYSAEAIDIISQVNAERVKHGLTPVKVSSSLTKAAYIRAKELTFVFSHTRPNGMTWSTVSAYANAENIARGYSTPDKAMAAWLTSAGHKRNILNSSYKTIGVCAYEHNGVMYWVQLFGTK